MNEALIPTLQSEGWDTSQLVLSSEQVGFARELHAWLARSPASLSQAIARFHGGEYATDQMRILEHELIRQFSPLPKAAKYLQVLCKVVDAINFGSAIRLPSPRIPNLAIRPRNPFGFAIPSALSCTRTWRDALSKNIARNDAVLDNILNAAPSAEFGKLFASAVLHGGLADPNLLVALARSQEHPKQSIVVINQRLVIELSISWQGALGSECRYWFPDPLTATLIAQLSRRTPPVSSNGAMAGLDTEQHILKYVWQCISAFFNTTLLKKDERPQSLGKFISNVKVDLQTRLPQVLVNYAGRSIVSHSLGKHVMARIHGLPQPSNTRPDVVQFTESTEQITKFNNTSDDLEDFEPHWLNQLRASFASQNRATIAREVDAIISGTQPDSTENCFAQFARHLVSARSASDNKLAPSTARAYLVTASKRLGGRLGDVDPRTLGTETLEVLYGEILEDADSESGTRKQRRRIARALHEFHHFLVQEFRLEPINAREVLGIGTGLLPVDANLITYDEYSKILVQIPNSTRILRPSIPAQEKLAMAAQLIFTLAFKCGMRRMEVLKLKIADLCEHDPAELLIRPSEARRLKTKSSTRKLPLYALLTQSELTALRDWKASRLTELQNSAPAEMTTQFQDHFLFGIPELEFEFIPQDTLFDIIHHAMRQETRDGSLRFHHLRHSFASWSFLRLMLSDLPSVPRLFPHLPETSAFLDDSNDFRTRLYGRPDPTRRHVYAVASLLGHSGPAISLEHYIHVCDMLVAFWLEKDIATPSLKMVIQRAARPKTTIYRWSSRGLSHVPFRLAKKSRLISSSKPEKPGAKQKVTDQAGRSASLSILDESSVFDRVWEVLHQHAMECTSIHELSASSGFTEAMISSFIEKAEVIRDMKTERGRGGYRHRMIETNLDRRYKDTKSRLACPIAPHTERDKRIANQLAPKLLSLIKSNPVLCQQVFQYYLDNSWQTRNELIFKDPDTPEHAKNFIEFINALGLKKSEVQYISYDTAERSYALAKWKENLGFSWRKKIIKNFPPRQTSVAARNWLGVKPMFAESNSLRGNTSTQ